MTASQAASIVLSNLSLEKCAETRIGNNVNRGISGGEKKRVSLAEVLLSRASVQCWDSSTSGLDSATTSCFINTLRLATSSHRNVTFAALYQVSQDTFDKFDKVLLLHEGHQIYFGPTRTSLAYFEALGFVRPRSFTVPDFLTALTHPIEVCALRKDCARPCPQQQTEFCAAWLQSSERIELGCKIEIHSREGGAPLQNAGAALSQYVRITLIL